MVDSITRGQQKHGTDVSRNGLKSAAIAWVVAIALSQANAGCTKSHAAPPRPDLAGIWDVTYDDVIDAEVHVGAHVEHVLLGPDGGSVVVSDGGRSASLQIDCRREELVCPHEVWPSELLLTNRMGDLDDDGESFLLSLAGEGKGACVLGNDSQLEAHVQTEGSARDGNWQTTALTGGRITTVLSGACVGASWAPGRDAVRIVLSSGISAVRR